MLSVNGHADAAVKARIRTGVIQAVGAIAYQGYIIAYERETVQQLCVK